MALRAIIVGLWLAASAAQAQTGPEQLSPAIETYKTAGDERLKAHVFSAREKTSERRAAVLLFHGGGWTEGEAEWTYGRARALAGMGLVAIPIQYRLTREGVSPLDALADACDAFAWTRANARRLGVDPRRIAAYGVSAGGQLSAAAGMGACPRRLRGPDLMLLWSPALDVAEDGWFRKIMAGKDPAKVSPLVLANRRGPPTAIVQGEADTLTPLKSAEAFCDRRRAAGGVCQIHRYPGLGHLLTRNIGNQESDFDIDPQASRDGFAKLQAFLVAQGYAKP
jgi:acetyl esterase/lipase